MAFLEFSLEEATKDEKDRLWPFFEAQLRFETANDREDKLRNLTERQAAYVESMEYRGDRLDYIWPGRYAAVERKSRKGTFYFIYENGAILVGESVMKSLPMSMGDKAKLHEIYEEMNR